MRRFLFIDLTEQEWAFLELMRQDQGGKTVRDLSQVVTSLVQEIIYSDLAEIKKDAA